MSPEKTREKEDVKSFVAPVKREIDKSVCPGCMRVRRGVYLASGMLTPFCDRFCEELHRRNIERKLASPWEEKRSSFFVEGATGINEAVARRLKETAQYEPAYFQ